MTTKEQHEQSTECGEPFAWIDKNRASALRDGHPVLTMLTTHCAFEDDVALYTTPYVAEPRPKREWVGLTDEERRGLGEWQKIQEELGPVWAPMMLYLYDAIEAKLKEKNT